MTTFLQTLETLPAEIIIEFRRNKTSDAIPAQVQAFILDLEAVLEIKETEKFHNISRLARELCKRRPDLQYRTALHRVYDALSYFHVNDNVSNDVWDKIYADKMEDLAKLAISTGNEFVAYKAIEKAHTFRTKSESRIRPEDLKAPIFIISPDIKPSDLGYEKASMMDIQRKYTEGKYLKLIDSLPVSDDSKEQLYKDAGIDITDVTEIENE